MESAEWKVRSAGGYKISRHPDLWSGFCRNDRVFHILLTSLMISVISYNKNGHNYINIFVDLDLAGLENLPGLTMIVIQMRDLLGFQNLAGLLNHFLYAC